VSIKVVDPILEQNHRPQFPRRATTIANLEARTRSWLWLKADCFGEDLTLMESGKGGGAAAVSALDEKAVASGRRRQRKSLRACGRREAGDHGVAGGPTVLRGTSTSGGRAMTVSSAVDETARSPPIETTTISMALGEQSAVADGDDAGFVFHFVAEHFTELVGRLV